MRAAGTLILVSRADGAAGAKANAKALGSSLSGDGNEVAFSSEATNLDPADLDSTFDVYVRDVAGNDTELISRASGLAGAKANKIAQSATISADGDQVAFTSPAHNLDPDQTQVTNDNQAYVRDRAADTTKLQSRADGVSGPIANDDVGEATISSDASALAFGSRSTNLDPADTDAINDAFVRDMGSGDTVLVSQSPVEAPLNANAESRDPSISADGRFVAFSSFATNIDPAATNNRSDIFVRDTTTGVTVLASREDGAVGAEGDENSSQPAISADGRYVAFETDTAFAGIDGDTESDIYVRDLIAHTTTLVSVNDGDSNVAAFAEEPSISGDGMRIAFETDGIYHPDDGNGFDDVYVRDLAAGETLLVSRPDGSTGDADEGSHLADISADGSTVAFDSRADHLTADPAPAAQQVFVRRIDADQTILASRADGAGGAIADADAREPTISGDGSRVAFSSDSTNLDPDKTSTTTQIFIRDLDALATDVASRADDGSVANQASTSPDLSHDGTYIAFQSSGTNLAPGAANARPDVFHRDLVNGDTVLATRADGGTGAEGNETSGDPAISEHGRLVAFGSAASNLDPADTDPTGDVYLRDVLGPDTTAPQTTITGGPAAGSFNATNAFSFTFTVGEPDATSECRIDGGSFSPCAGSFGTGALSEGQHTFEARSTDRAGNVEAPAASRTFTVDTVAPNTLLIGAPAGPIADSTPTFDFGSTEPGSSFQCALDGAALGACNPGVTLGPLADGEHSVAVRAIDPAANVDASPALAAFAVDTEVSGREVSAKGKQKQKGEKVKLVAKLTPGEAVTATLTGKVKLGKGLELREVTSAIADGESAKLTGKLKRKQNDEVIDQLERGKKLKAKLVVEVFDALGNSVTTTETVKLK